MKVFISTILVLALLIACAQAPQENAPVRPPADAADQDFPAEPDAPEVQDAEPGTTAVLTDADKSTALDINSVECDLAEKKISFRFRNDDTKNWQMNGQVPFPAPQDLAPVRVYINSYEVNGRNPYLKDGVRQFGPEELFSDNCGGVEILEPGEDVTCTLQPVPLKAANEFTAGKNEILINSPTSKNIIQFTCG